MEYDETKNLPKLKLSEHIGELEDNINVDDLSQDFLHFLISKRWFLVFICLPLSIAWAAFGCYLYFIASLGNDFEQLSGYAFEIILFPLLSVVAAFVGIRVQFRDSFYEQFASLSKLSFHRLGNGISVCSLGTIFKIYSDHAIKDVVCGKFFGRDMNMYICQPRTGYGSSITVMEVNIRNLLPNVLLVNKKSRLAASLNRKFNSVTKHKNFMLEGDFNKYFDLYGNEDCNIEILQIFSPEFMQLLVDSSLQYSIELCGLTMFIYSNKVITKRDQLFEMLNFAKNLTKELTPVSNRISDDEMLALNPIISEYI